MTFPAPKLLRPPAAPQRSLGMSDVEAFVHEHQAAVWRYLRLLGAPAADADDLLQDTLLRFLAREVPRPGARAMLRAIARGLWIDRHRWLRRRRAVAWADEIDRALASTPANDDHELWLDALAACRANLSERAGRALDLAYRDGRSRREIAGELGLAENTVRNLLASTRDALRTCIEKRLRRHDGTERGDER